MKKILLTFGSWLMGLVLVSVWLVGIGKAEAILQLDQDTLKVSHRIYAINADEDLGPEWENAGIYGAGASHAAYDPTNGDVYLATNGAFYRSTDGGQIWNRIVRDGNQALIVDQVDGRVYLGLAARREIWISGDHGSTWDIQPVVGEPRSFALDPNNRNPVFLGTAHSSTGDSGVVYRSLDRGATWTTTVVDADHCISSVAVNPTDGNNIWAVSWGCGTLLDHSAVFSSTDQGLSYNLVLSNTNPFAYYQILFDSNGIIYLAGDGVRISSNGGITFTAPALVGKVPTGIYSMVRNPVTDRVHVSTSEGGYHSDSGSSWVHDGLPGLLGIDPNDSNHMLAISPQGVQRSTDSGTSWQESSTGLEQVIVEGIAGHAQDAAMVYATTHFGGGRSLDGGDTWEFPNTSGSPRGLAVSPLTSTLAFMGQSGGSWVYSTTNGGDTWFQTQITNTEGHIRQIAIDPLNPNIVYATVSTKPNDPFADTSKDGLYMSTNSGGTWENAGLLGMQINAVALGADQSQVTVYAGEGDVFWGQTTGGLWRLDPGASDWVYKGPTNTIVSQIAVDPRDPSHVYLASNNDFDPDAIGGLFESHDGGNTWDWIYPNAYIIALVLDPQDPDIIYFSTGGGLYRSLDGGATWEEYDRHPFGSFNTLYFNYADIPTVFAGTGEGIFRRRLGDKVQAQPGLAATLQFTTAQGTMITIEIPAGAVTAPVDLLFTDIPNLTNLEAGLQFANHAFNLDAFDSNGKIPAFTFQTPVTVTIAYSDTDVADLDEGQLHLLYVDGQDWTDAGCGPYLRDPDNNWLQVPVCHLSQFGLFQTSSSIYLPLITR